MHYTLHQLQIFLKITQTRSITKAAEELHLTQPAVSIQLKNLQDQFEIPLTEVIGRQLYDTDFGAEIAIAVEKIGKPGYGIEFCTLCYQSIELIYAVYPFPYGFQSSISRMNQGFVTGGRGILKPAETQ